MKQINIKELKPRKNQQCCVCKKLLQDDWAYNGKWFCGKCKAKDSDKRIDKFLNTYAN